MVTDGVVRRKALTREGRGACLLGVSLPMMREQTRSRGLRESEVTCCRSGFYSHTADMPILLRRIFSRLYPGFKASGRAKA